MNTFKSQLIELYRKSFDESEGYIDYFFRRRYKEENVVCVERGGHIISALHLLPQKIMIDGKGRSAGFVSSAATLPQYRGQGIFFETMAKAYEAMNERGMEFCVLYPFKHDYYKKHGFIEYSFVKTRKVPPLHALLGQAGQNGDAGRKYKVERYSPQDTKLQELIAGAYERMCRGFEGWIIRDVKEWEYRFGEVAADGGTVLTVKSEDNITGYAFTGKGKIEECCFTDFADGRGGYLIDSVKEAAGMEYAVPLRVKLRDAKALTDAVPFGMIKKAGCTAEQTYEFFRDKSCALLDKF